MNTYIQCFNVEYNAENLDLYSSFDNTLNFFLFYKLKSIENLIFGNPSPGKFPFLHFLLSSGHVEKRI